jgi:hypothetical protein
MRIATRVDGALGRERNIGELGRKLWLHYRRASHRRAIFKATERGHTGVVMVDETTAKKDTMKVEKVSLLVLTLCIVVLVYVLVARPF